jgi:hypothetical protein
MQYRSRLRSQPSTHSEDCIAGFEHVLNASHNNFDGKLIRLDNVDGQIKQVEYNILFNG